MSLKNVSSSQGFDSFSRLGFWLDYEKSIETKPGFWPILWCWKPYPKIVKILRIWQFYKIFNSKMNCHKSRFALNLNRKKKIMKKYSRCENPNTQIFRSIWFAVSSTYDFKKSHHKYFKCILRKVHKTLTLE